MEYPDSPYVIGDFERPADVTYYKSDLGDAGYESYASQGIEAFGRQAGFDILADGSASAGLRVTIERGTNRRAEESNGYAVSVTEGAALSVTLTDTAGAEAVAIVLAAATTMAQLKAAVDAVAGLASEYFGGETGTGGTAAQDVDDSAGASYDRWAAVQVSTNGAYFRYLGESAPADDSGSVIARGDVEAIGRFMLPPGQQVWLKRTGTGDVPGSLQIWKARHEAAA